MIMHEYFPGANTPQGFVSYFQYILPPEKTKKKIILKGGPGTGKSSLMKKVSALLKESGISVDLLHCSSDPASLDAIVAKSIGFCMVDGTTPHIVDPILPGASDTILHLGEYWDATEIQKHKYKIQSTSKKISEHFASAYDYLNAASHVQTQITKKSLYNADEEKITKLLNDLVVRLNITASFQKRGCVQKAFLSGFTPIGNMDYIHSYTNTAKRVICIQSEANTAPLLTSRLADRIENSGRDAVFFYCPMQPTQKVEHIYLPQENIFITTQNTYHKPEAANEYIDLTPYCPHTADLRADTDMFNILLARAVSCIHGAKALHDELEQFYIPHMDFDAMADLPNKILQDVL